MAGLAQGSPQTAEAGPGTILLAWTAHPLRRRPAHGILAGGAILGAGVGLGYLTRSAFWMVFSVALLFLSLESFFLATRYELGAEGLCIRKAFSRSVMEWGRFRRVYQDRHGLTLSPYRRRAFLEPYRSARLLFDGGDAAAIRDLVRGRLSAEVEWLPAEKPGSGGGTWS
jgi:hypothetical protein